MTKTEDGPSKCLHKVSGFELYEDTGKKPFVIWRHTTRTKDPANKGEYIVTKHVDQLRLMVEDFPRTKTALVAFAELKTAWREWTEWNSAMKSGAQ